MGSIQLRCLFLCHWCHHHMIDTISAAEYTSMPVEIRYHIQLLDCLCWIVFTEVDCSFCLSACLSVWLIWSASVCSCPKNWPRRLTYLLLKMCGASQAVFPVWDGLCRGLCSLPPAYSRDVCWMQWVISTQPFDSPHRMWPHSQSFLLCTDASLLSVAALDTLLPHQSLVHHHIDECLLSFGIHNVNGPI
jgi:hypothetical protein